MLYYRYVRKHLLRYNTTTTVDAPLDDSTRTATACATIQAPYTVSTVGPVENESASGFTLNPAAQPFPTY